MKILHTSDWHLGRTLYGKKRYHEFEAFLSWLADTIHNNAIDALLVAGDIFDTTVPGNRAQELYYRFLARLSSSTCRHVIVIGGNHDSPSFLNAPKELLKIFNVSVVGNAVADPAEEVLLLRNEKGVAELLVCAVPYLRDRDIRTVEAGESIQDKEQKLIDGIRNHYAEVTAFAEKKRTELGLDIPIVATGHLFTAGGQTVDGDGVRELYVGSLSHITSEIFPCSINYVALGHLHIPQTVDGRGSIRYSGSPIPMGFGEANQQKSVCEITFDKNNGTETNVVVRLIDVPVFQKLARLNGSIEEIEAGISKLLKFEESVWLEVTYDGKEIIGDLRERLETAVAGSSIEILRIKNNLIVERTLSQHHEGETLDDLDVFQVFERCMTAQNISDEQRPELLRTYQEAYASLNEEDETLEGEVQQ